MAASTNPFGQVLVALVTPFTADGEVDWAGVEKHIDDVIQAGADGIVVTGTTGETSTLTDAEKQAWHDASKNAPEKMIKKMEGRGFAYARPAYTEMQKIKAELAP